MTTLISRSDAQARGLRHYFTGEPCKNGHRANRYTQSGACYECIRQSTYAERERHAAKRAADVNLPEIKRFTRETMIVKHRVPEASVPALSALIAGMVAAHFPTLVDEERVVIAPPPAITQRAGLTCVATFLTHRDDLDAVDQLCRAAIRNFGLQQQRDAQP